MQSMFYIYFDIHIYTLYVHTCTHIYTHKYIHTIWKTTVDVDKIRKDHFTDNNKISM